MVNFTQSEEVLLREMREIKEGQTALDKKMAGFCAGMVMCKESREKNTLAIDGNGTPGLKRVTEKNSGRIAILYRFIGIGGSGTGLIGIIWWLITK